MKSNKGITLIMVIITIVFLSLLITLVVKNGVDTYEKSQVINFETYMKMIQKKVDLLVENGVDYTTIGSPVSDENKTKLQTIINSNSAIATQNVDSNTLRQFSAEDIANIFEINDVNDEIIVNFANRDVISLNGIKNNNTMHYVEYTLH